MYRLSWVHHLKWKETRQQPDKHGALLPLSFLLVNLQFSVLNPSRIGLHFFEAHATPFASLHKSVN